MESPSSEMDPAALYNKYKTEANIREACAPPKPCPLSCCGSMKSKKPLPHQRVEATGVCPEEFWVSFIPGSRTERETCSSLQPQTTFLDSRLNCFEVVDRMKSSSGSSSNGCASRLLFRFTWSIEASTRRRSS